MPIYEYVCNDCGHELEALQKLSDVLLTDCPECDNSSLKKIISAPSFRLSGSGWYETDFKTSNQKNLTKSDSADKSSSDKSPSKANKDSSSKASTSKPSPKKDTKSKGAAA